MKKCSFFLAGLLLTAGMAHAQLNRPSAFTIGFKAGGTASKFIGGNARDEHSIYGFHAGLTFHIGDWQGFYVQPELLYSQKGSKQKLYDAEVTRRLTYLDIPVPIRYQSGSLFAEAGPQLGILLAAKSDYNPGGATTDVKDGLETVDVGYLLGIGYQPVRGGFGVGARYNGAFTRVPKDVEVPGQATIETSLRNSALQVYVSYFLKSRRRR